MTPQLKAFVNFPNGIIETTFMAKRQTRLIRTSWNWTCRSVEGGGRVASAANRCRGAWGETKAANTGRNDYWAYVADHCGRLFPWHKCKVGLTQLAIRIVNGTIPRLGAYVLIEWPGWAWDGLLWLQCSVAAQRADTIIYHSVDLYNSKIFCSCN
eukprot:6158817-Pleurochrysis_carterae.AAC.4